MDLTKAVLPDSVEVSGRVYRIKTGHPYWFRFAEIIGQETKYIADFEYLYIDERPEDRQAGVDALYKFYYEEKEIPRCDEPGDRVIDYAIDADLLYSGILQCYGIDLADKEYHWHKVRAMIAGLNGTKLNDVISYRSWTDQKNKEMIRMKRIWALPVKVDPVDSEALNRFSDLFYGAQFEGKK